MAVPLLEPYGEGQTDRHPSLMDQPAKVNEHELIIDISRGGAASTSHSHGYDQNDLGELHYEHRPSTSTPALVFQPSSVSPTSSDSRNASLTQRSDNYGHQHGIPLNSGLWISVELVVNVRQIIAAIIVISLSRHEHPKTPLLACIIGYTVAVLPLFLIFIGAAFIATGRSLSKIYIIHFELLLRTTLLSLLLAHTFLLHKPQKAKMIIAMLSYLSSRAKHHIYEINALVDHFKMALDCVFAVWFVVGNVWIFGGRSSSQDAPNLYRLCIVFLMFSCIGYAMPFVLCAMICCCLPCIISIMGLREDMSHNRGATSESINALPTYKFKSKQPRNGEESEINSDSQGDGGILASGTDEERMISAEDAVCCICLANYVNNDELRELPCAHYFHMECVDKWLKTNALCPLCKSKVESTTGSSGTNSGRHHSDRGVGNGAELQQEI